MAKGMLALLAELNTRRRVFIGGFRSAKYRSESKYKPHQGKRETARRVSQASR